jgi:hypothetical protein
MPIINQPIASINNNNFSNIIANSPNDFTDINNIIRGDALPPYDVLFLNNNDDVVERVSVAINTIADVNETVRTRLNNMLCEALRCNNEKKKKICIYAVLVAASIAADAGCSYCGWEVGQYTVSNPGCLPKLQGAAYSWLCCSLGALLGCSATAASNLLAHYCLTRRSDTHHGVITQQPRQINREGDNAPDLPPQYESLFPQRQQNSVNDTGNNGTGRRHSAPAMVDNSTPQQHGSVNTRDPVTQQPQRQQNSVNDTRNNPTGRRRSLSLYENNISSAMHK